jgi:Sec-independent protein translocase protein TatA
MGKQGATDFVLFGEKKLSDIFQEIYSNQRTKKQKIGDLIEEFKKNIRHAGDIAEVGMVIKDLVKFSIENDEMLVKMASIAQRIIASESKVPGDDGFLTEAERAQLMEELEKSAEEVQKETQDRVTDIEAELEELQTKLK